MLTKLWVHLALLGMLCSGSALHSAEMPLSPENFSARYLAREPVEGIPLGLTFDQALQYQARWVQQLSKKLGPPVGMKVGLVTRAGQERLKLDHPIRGVLLKDMLLPNHSRVGLDYAIRPIVEPDLIVKVKDNAINRATSIEELAEHLDSVIVFIELADGIVSTNLPIDGGVITACNVGARAGILGESIPVQSTPKFLETFRNMKLVMKDGTGTEISRTEASGIMGHPLNALLWLVQDLQKRGGALKAGDLVSLGSPSPQISPKPGDRFSLTYEGFEKPLSAGVIFK